jgi:hypothetical protein
MQRNAQQAGQPTAQFVQSEVVQAETSGQSQPIQRGPHRGFDAVEGTARDPLLNKTFDLTSVKTIPQLR